MTSFNCSPVCAVALEICQEAGRTSKSRNHWQPHLTPLHLPKSGIQCVVNEGGLLISSPLRPSKLNIWHYHQYLHLQQHHLGRCTWLTYSQQEASYMPNTRNSSRYGPDTPALLLDFLSQYPTIYMDQHMSQTPATTSSNYQTCLSR